MLKLVKEISRHETLNPLVLLKCLRYWCVKQRSKSLTSTYLSDSRFKTKNYLNNTACPCDVIIKVSHLSLVRSLVIYLNACLAHVNTLHVRIVLCLLLIHPKYYTVAWYNAMQPSCIYSRGSQLWQCRWSSAWVSEVCILLLLRFFYS